MSKVLALAKTPQGPTTGPKKKLKIDPRCRPYANSSIDELFEEVVMDAEWAKGLLEFARGLYAENNTDKVDASAVMAFVDSVRMPLLNVVDALVPIMNELKQREAEREA